MPADDPREYRAAMTDRTALVLGGDAVRRFGETSVIVFGLGGVGSWCAEALVRTGIGHLTIVDHDVICAGNINRQAQATSRTIGKPKAGALGARLAEINPHARVNARAERFTAESAGEFGIGSYDYIIDAIDSVDDKIVLIETAIGARKTIFSSMGAAARTDPTRVRTARLGKTHGCPLARTVRRRLKHAGVFADFICVYSDEPVAEAQHPDKKATLCENDAGRRKRINGSLVQVTAVFGFTLAGLVVSDVAGIPSNSRSRT
ncbi:MAG TPA: tRNA threonylcarbamoyladenosine dehydratase [Spirochaetota bacterium]|nr:tRNA threonylcarbamoyladenosine dehydratase [Spirochaetota bacterium]